MNNLGGHDLPSVLEAFHAADQRQADLLHLLHGQGLRPADGRPQGQSRRADDAGADGDIPPGDGRAAGPRMGQVRGPGAAGRAACRNFSTSVPFAAGERAPADRRRRSPCRTNLPAPQPGGDLDADRLRRHPQRDRPRRQRLRPPHRHHLAGRDRLDQSRAAGSTGAGCSRARRWPTPSRASASRRPSIGSSRRKGQHIELGIAEMNLFILLSALGLSHTINGERLLPIGTLYDPFIARGLDALNYACYQDARFILVATPSGITLAGEGGAHQSIAEPLIGLAQDGLAAFEPAYRRRARRHHALGLRLYPEGRRCGAVRKKLAARRDRRLGLSAAVDAADRADRARDDGRAAPADRRRRLLAAQAGPERAGGRRLYRRGRAGSDRRGRPDGGGPPRRRPARRSPRPTGSMPAGPPRSARASAGWCMRARISSGCSPTCRRIAASSPCSTAIRRRSPGSARSPATARGRSASSISARPARIADLYRHYGIDANAIVAAAQAIAPGRPIRHLKALP